MVVVAFPARRAPKPRKRRRRAAILVFPLARRHELVERLARALREMSPAGRETFLDREFGQLCDELANFGISCEDCRDQEIIALAREIGRSLHGPDFVLDDDAEEAAR
ncbi:MAG: DUF6074 family protein [Chthoniobacter sp.]|nr:DUF6074 family protein [Chthoniobacter sp.]